MIRLENPWMVYGLLILPVLVLFYWLAGKLVRRRLKSLGEEGLLKSLSSDVSQSILWLKNGLMLLAVALLILGLANPQIGSRMEEVKRQGVDIIIALDISNSMKAEDIRPNRLARAKQAISRFSEQLRNDRIGVIVFAGNAYVQLPLTVDYGAAKMFASIIESEMIPTQGTAVGAAIDLARESFSKDDKKYKALIIISDGENHEDDAMGSARLAAQEGIVIHTIGMGSPEGAPIPSERGGGFRKDQQGNTILSKLDEQLLYQIASEGNGRFVRASTSNDGLESLLHEINKMEKKDFGAKIYTDYESRFQYFIGFAFLLLCVEFFFTGKKIPLLSGIQIFNPSGKNNHG